MVMLNKAANQICSLLAKMLVHVKTGRASAESMRRMLTACKTINAQLAALQAAAAAAVARLEDHRDGGAGMLRASTGVSTRQARRHMATAESLGRIPAVREAVEEGRITFANADALAKASRKTSAEAVQADPELLAQAQKMPEDMFAKQAQRWAARRQRDRGEADYKKLRARRSLRFWSGDDGMTHLRGAFDPVAGERIRTRLEHIAAQFHRKDRKQTKNNHSVHRGRGSRSSFPTANGSEPHPRGGAPAVPPHRRSFPTANGSEPAMDTHQPHHRNQVPRSLNSDSRSFEQCTADALEQLITKGSLAGSSIPGTGSDPVSGSIPGTGSNSASIGKGSRASGSPAGGSIAGSGLPGIGSSLVSGSSNCDGGCDGSITLQPTADILVYADIAALQPGSDSGSGFAAEIAGGRPIPPSALRRLMCNARVTGLLFNGPGQPLWCGRSRRTASTAQLKALRLRDKGCIGCAADPDRCQAHHIEPWHLGGATDIDNLVLVCYECHHRIHDDNWQITKTPDNRHILRPPKPPPPAQPPKPPSTMTQPRLQPDTPQYAYKETPILRKHPPPHTSQHPRTPTRPEQPEPLDRNLPLLC